MKKLILLVLILLVVAGGLGYWRGWFDLNQGGKVGIQIDPEKFKNDREDFSRSLMEKAKVMKDRVDDLWKKSEGVPNDGGTAIQMELDELKQKHDQLVQKIKDLVETNRDNFENSKQECSTSLDAVDKKIEELTKKVEVGKAK